MFVEDLTHIYSAHADPDNSFQMSRYMKGKFVFFGIKTDQRRLLSAPFLQKEKRPPYDMLPEVVHECWEAPQREIQYTACDLVLTYKKEYRFETLELAEYMITRKSWWDTVDVIAKHVAGRVLKIFPAERGPAVEKWMNSGNLWLQRTALLFQLGYKQDTDRELLVSLIERLKGSDEFFIRKAIGWALREYSRIDPVFVEQYISSASLSGLSAQEGMKRIRSGSAL